MKEKRFNLKLPKLSGQSLLIVAGLFGILLIGIGPLLSSGSAKASAAQETPDAAAYAAALETRLTQLLSRTAGVGKAEVMVTLDGGYTYDYATTENVGSDILKNEKTDEEVKTQEKITTETSYIMVESGGGEQPLVTKRLDPAIRGVVVACEGGGDPAVAMRVTETVKVALGIGAGRIAVVELGAG